MHLAWSCQFLAFLLFNHYLTVFWICYLKSTLFGIMRTFENRFILLTPLTRLAGIKVKAAHKKVIEERE
jgi:hypothetical protein